MYNTAPGAYPQPYSVAIHVNQSFPSFDALTDHLGVFFKCSLSFGRSETGKALYY